MSCKKKGEWEIRKIEETWKDGKKFWSMIKELLGNNKEREEDTFVYTQEGEKKDRRNMERWEKVLVHDKRIARQERRKRGGYLCIHIRRREKGNNGNVRKIYREMETVNIPENW